MSQALVPLKDLVQAKTRLAGLLRPSERRALAQAMVEDVLGVLSLHPRVSRVILLSDDPGAHLLAARYDAIFWDEAGFHCRGLNPLIGAASGRMLEDRDEAILVLHGDIPMLKAPELNAVIAAQEQLGGLIIGCDRAGLGTNLLAFDRQSVPEFHFGEGSCALHRAAAERGGIPVRVMQLEGVGMDVDAPADLSLLVSMLADLPDRQTAKLLLNTSLGERITLAMQTLSTGVGPEGNESLRNTP